MQNIESILAELGIEVPEDKKADLTKKTYENYKTIEEFNTKIKKIEVDRDKFKTDFETAKATLDGFEGKDIDQITKDRDDWKQKAIDAEKDYATKLSEREYSDAVSKAAEGIKFSSNSAKKAFIAELEKDPLKMKDGKILGFDDYVKSYKESDATAFVPEQEESKAKFTDPMNNGSGGNQDQPITGDPNKMDYGTYKKWREQNQ